jgi:hypothetical protein
LPKKEIKSNLSIPRIMSFAVKNYYPGICGPKVMISTNGLIFLIPQCDVDILLPLIPSIMYIGGSSLYTYMTQRDKVIVGGCVYGTY